ncbi:MAG: hypothetical protein VX643_03505 [Chloroflexota bacterium]|nr:hypothetical protein [Chloroflexota bacterium]MEE2881046.1 hypothetical protein [Chloroflexota bacterium]
MRISLMIKKVLGFPLKLLADRMKLLKDGPIWAYPLLIVFGPLVGAIYLAFWLVMGIILYFLATAFLMVGLMPLFWLDETPRWVAVAGLIVYAFYLGWMFDKRERPEISYPVRRRDPEEIYEYEIYVESRDLWRPLRHSYDSEIWRIRPSNQKLIIQRWIILIPLLMGFGILLVPLFQIPLTLLTDAAKWFVDIWIWPANKLGLIA